MTTKAFAIFETLLRTKHRDSIGGGSWGGYIHVYFKVNPQIGASLVDLFNLHLYHVVLKNSKIAKWSISEIPFGNCQGLGLTLVPRAALEC